MTGLGIGRAGRRGLILGMLFATLVSSDERSAYAQSFFSCRPCAG